ncbi:hypothetical protein Aperf_G00000005191 [Anoplocephala perfoliata]
MPEGADDVKKQQLMELAIMNGTYRDPQQQHSRHHSNNSSSQHSSPSPLSPSLTFDDLEHKERQQAQVQQMTQQQQHQFILQQQYLSMLSSQSAIAAALVQNPAAQLLGTAGLRFGTPTASPHPTAVAAANPLFLGATANAPSVNPATPSAAAAMSLAAAVMGGMPPLSPSASSAATQQIGVGLSSEQLAALLGVANGTVSPNGADHSAAMAAASLRGSFPTNSVAGANIIGDYSNSNDLDSNSDERRPLPPEIIL